MDRRISLDLIIFVVTSFNFEVGVVWSFELDVEVDELLDFISFDFSIGDFAIAIEVQWHEIAVWLLCNSVFGDIFEVEVCNRWHTKVDGFIIVSHRGTDLLVEAKVIEERCLQLPDEHIEFWDLAVRKLVVAAEVVFNEDDAEVNEWDLILDENAVLQLPFEHIDEFLACEEQIGKDWHIELNFSDWSSFVDDGTFGDSENWFLKHGDVSCCVLRDLHGEGNNSFFVVQLHERLHELEEPSADDLAILIELIAEWLMLAVLLLCPDCFISTDAFNTGRKSFSTIYKLVKNEIKLRFWRRYYFDFFYYIHNRNCTFNEVKL